MSTTPDTAKPAQQAFTDAQLQAAIDAAFATCYFASALEHKLTSSQPEEASRRLAIARAFLAELGKIKPAIDIEAMLADCLPGGQVCDPQQVADAIRTWFATQRPSESDPYARLKAYAAAGARIRVHVTSTLVGDWKIGTGWKWDGEVSTYEVHPDDLHLVPEYAPKHPDDQQNWNQYAEKPSWSLPPPPAGHKWHRDDWTEDMLPKGSRPLLDGELIEKSDEVWQYAEGPWKNETIAVGLTVSSSNHHFRTRRPLPSWSQANAELIEKAEAAGVDLDAQPEEPAWIPHDGGPCPLKDEEVEEWEYKMRDGDHIKHPDGEPSAYCWNHKGYDHDIMEYRVTKPAQPWQPTPGDVVRLKSGGPEMTVDTLVETENGETVYRCFWIGSDGRPFGFKLPAIMLEPANKKD